MPIQTKHKKLNGLAGGGNKKDIGINDVLPPSK